MRGHAPLTVVLHAWAVMTMLLGEPAAQRVRSLILDWRPGISSINLGEVLYSPTRTVGWAFADDRVDGVPPRSWRWYTRLAYREKPPHGQGRRRAISRDTFCLEEREARWPLAIVMRRYEGPVDLIELRVTR